MNGNLLETDKNPERNSGKDLRPIEKMSTKKLREIWTLQKNLQRNWKGKWGRN